MNQGYNSSALIIGSGEDVPAHPPGSKFNAELVICADGGARLARLWELRPTIIIGDQDSLDSQTKAYWKEQGIPFQRALARKDETDLELAVEYALQAGATNITLVGAWGSRIDHSLGNIEILYRLAKDGISNTLLTRNHRLISFTKEFREQVQIGSFVSLIPLSPLVEGVQTTGLEYPLKGDNLSKGSTLSISNLAQSSQISVEIISGVLLAILEQ